MNPDAAGSGIEIEPMPGARQRLLAGRATVFGGRAKDRLRLPSFHFGPRVGVLPAFGAFTGMQALQRAAGDRVWAIAGDRVIAAPPTLTP